jgi:hypothetical protein
MVYLCRPACQDDDSRQPCPLEFDAVKVIVTGMIASYPLGGVVWDYAQYALALERLGYEVYYLEDTGYLNYDPRERQYVADPSYGVQFLGRSLARLSETLGRRWHLRASDDRMYGMESATFASVLGQAELFLNVSGGTLVREEYLQCRRKVLIDTDPGKNHFLNYPRQDSGKRWSADQGYRSHDFFLTYAERIGRPGCTLPTLGLTWHPTRPPVLLDLWKPVDPASRWTTVMGWNNFSEALEYQGVRYGSKEIEFEKVKEIPRRSSAAFEVATGGAPPRDEWRSYGWSVLDAHDVSRTADDYRDYIQSSRGEFSVAKNVYVATRSGWFSCRSVCYLAAGRPAVVQDTGFSEIIPCGAGLLAFSSPEEAVDAIERIENDYTRHQTAARRVASEFFSADVVVNQLLADVGMA